MNGNSGKGCVSSMMNGDGYDLRYAADGCSGTMLFCVSFCATCETDLHFPCHCPCHFPGLISLAILFVVVNIDKAMMRLVFVGFWGEMFVNGKKRLALFGTFNLFIRQCRVNHKSLQQ